jgi:hypothetical protein
MKTRNFFFLLCAGFVLAVFSLASATDTLTTKDGTKHSGTFISATQRTITFREAGMLRHFSKSNVQSVEFGTSEEGVTRNAAAKSALPGSEPGTSREVTLPTGSEIAVLTNQLIDSSTATEGQTFRADVASNVTDSSGRVLIPKGSEAELVIRKVVAGGVTSTPEVALDLQSIKVRGRRYTVNTQNVEQKAEGGIGKNRRTAEMIGGGAALGTLIGAIAGGGKGAAIGAATGAAAGAGTQILTRGKTVKVPAETTLRFKLDQPLRLEAAY